MKNAHDRMGSRVWVRRVALGLALLAAGCAGSQPVQVQLPPGARIGVLNLVEAQMTHLEMGALRFNSFTNVYPVAWDLPGYLTRRIETGLKQRGDVTFVSLAADMDPGRKQSMAATLQSSVNTWLSGDLKDFLQQAAADNRLDLVVTVSSYRTGTQPPDSCFAVYKTDLPTQGYGVFTRMSVVPGNQWVPVGGNKAHAYANILTAIFQTRPVGLAAYAFAPCSDQEMAGFPWPADIHFLGAAQFDALRPAVESIAAESVRTALSKAGL
jgi:hypothetical protein